MSDLKILSLFKQISEGDVIAFRQLFTDWYLRVFNTAYGYIKSRELARDIVQQVFLKIWERRTILGNVKDPASWLISTTKYQAFQVLKKESLENGHIDQLIKVLPEEVITPESSLIFRQQEEIIRKTIDQLTAKQREAYLLHRQEGLTYQQIADRTSVSTDTVREHVYKALKFIKASLERHKDDLISLAIIYTINFL